MNRFNEIKPEALDKNIFHMINDEWMLITAEKDNKINTMTASWGGFGILWNKKVSYVVIRPQRYTKEFVDHASTFSLCFFGEEYKKTLAYLGSVSGRDENKIEKAKLSLGHVLDTPYFEEADLVIICKKLYAQDLKADCFIAREVDEAVYPHKDYHTMYISEILKIYKKGEK